MTGTQKTFALVRWLDEEQIGVMPVFAASNIETVFVGSITQIKCNKGKKLYDLEILKFHIMMYYAIVLVPDPTPMIER